MTHKLDTIRRKCIEANPEIVELRFGCKLRHDSGDMYTVVRKERGDWIKTLELGDDDSVMLKFCEILGRPIRLADVLLAMRVEHSEYSVSSAGYFEEWSLNQPPDVFHLTANSSARWNLVEDDLTKQSEQTIDFLYELLP
jgi:hypothetical protein